MYRSTSLSATACFDDELVRVGFMDPENWGLAALIQ